MKTENVVFDRIGRAPFGLLIGLSHEEVDNDYSCYGVRAKTKYCTMYVQYPR